MLLHKNTQRVVFSLLSIYIYVSPKSFLLLYEMMSAFLSNAPAVSDGCAPFAIHSLIAGAFKEDSFLIGSYQPKNSIGNPSRLFLESIATNL